MEKKITYIMLRISKEEKKKIKKLAESERLTVSEYVRKKCLGGTKDERRN